MSIQEVLGTRVYTETMSNGKRLDLGISEQEAYQLLFNKTIQRAEKDGAFCYQKVSTLCTLGNPETLSLGTCQVSIEAFFNFDLEEVDKK